MRTVMDMAKNDEISTPPEAIDPLLLYVPVMNGGKRTVIWEMCPGSGAMLRHLNKSGFRTVQVSDSLLSAPATIQWDVAITNPPWSKKHLFLERCVKLGTSFALLLPVRTLGVRRCQVWMKDVDVLFLKKRVDFTDGGAPYEACAWFTRGLLPDRIVFEA